MIKWHEQSHYCHINEAPLNVKNVSMNISGERDVERHVTEIQNLEWRVWHGQP
jgi:hypothetical protein